METPNCCSERSSSRKSHFPLCVDLDGTLVRGDCLFAALFWLLKHRPQTLLKLMCGLVVDGVAAFKRQVAEQAVGFDASKMPLESAVLLWCAEMAKQGRQMCLVTGSDLLWANQIAAKFPFFVDVIASDRYVNVSGEGKRFILVELFGERGFDYVGNSRKDLTVWRSARQAIVANASPAFVRRVKKICRVSEVIGRPPDILLALFRTIRFEQWIKNVLLLAPVITSHSWSNWEILPKIGVGISIFCILSSGVYLVNDAWDCEEDRKDVVKSRRPVAAGELGQWTAFLCGLSLLGCGLLLAVPTGWGFTFWACLYAAIALLYSFYLKRVLGFDLAVLVGFYLIRICAGGEIADISVSPWLMSLSFGMFLFLASLKRAMGSGHTWKKVQRVFLNSVGAAAAAVVVVTLLFYPISSQAEELYSKKYLLWILPIVVALWCRWIWQKCIDQAKNYTAAEPVAVVLRDVCSWFVLAVCLGVMLCAI